MWSNSALRKGGDHARSTFDLPQDLATYNKPESKEYPPEREKLCAAIDYMHSLIDVWDECWGTVPDRRALATAKQFIRLMPRLRKFPGTISPNGDTGICLYWKTGTENMIVTVEHRLLHMSYTYGNGGPEDVFVDGIGFDLETIPSVIVKYLPKRDT